MRQEDHGGAHSDRTGVVAANLAVLYVVFGSTYLAIRVTVETVPPLLGAGLRFVAAGALLYLATALRRRRLILPSQRELLGTAIIGTLVIGGGLGLLTVGERSVPSGVAALLIASVPAWVLVLRTVSGDRVGIVSWLGVTVGLGGVATLVWAARDGGGADAGGVLLLLIAALATALGSFGATRVQLPDDSLLSAALQMLLVGPLLCVAGIVLGEDFTPAAWSARSVLALLYLVTAGSVVAYASFVWLISNTPALTATTYTYVTPAIALLLGWLVLGERVTPAVFISAAAICVGVATVLVSESRGTGAGDRPA